MRKLLIITLLLLPLALQAQVTRTNAITHRQASLDSLRLRNMDTLPLPLAGYGTMAVRRDSLFFITEDDSVYNLLRVSGGDLAGIRDTLAFHSDSLRIIYDSLAYYYLNTQIDSIFDADLLNGITFNQGANRTIKIGQATGSGANGYTLIVRGGDAELTGSNGGNTHITAGEGLSTAGKVFLYGGLDGLSNRGAVFLGHNGSIYTGDVYAQTQSLSDSTQRVATTAFVHGRVYNDLLPVYDSLSNHRADLENAVGGTYWTLSEEQILEANKAVGLSAFLHLPDGRYTFSNIPIIRANYGDTVSLSMMIDDRKIVQASMVSDGAGAGFSPELNIYGALRVLDSVVGTHVRMTAQVEGDSVNAVTKYLLNGTDITVTGTLDSIAYRNQDNDFLQSQTIQGRLYATDVHATDSISGDYVLVNDTLATTAFKMPTGASNGYVLKTDANGVASWQMITSAYKGTWNANTNTPTLADNTGVNGDFYIVSVGDTVDLGSGDKIFITGGTAVHNGSVWEPVNPSQQVTSVNSLIGDVQLDLSLDGDTLSLTGSPDVDLSTLTSIVAVKDSISDHRTDIGNLQDSIAIHRGEITAIYDSLLLHRDTLWDHANRITRMEDSILVHRGLIEAIYDSLDLHRDSLWDHSDRITALERDTANLLHWADTVSFIATKEDIAGLQTELGLTGIRDTLARKQDIIFQKTADSTAIPLYPIELASLMLPPDSRITTANAPVLRALNGDTVDIRTTIDDKRVLQAYGVADGAGSLSSTGVNLLGKLHVNGNINLLSGKSYLINNDTLPLTGIKQFNSATLRGRITDETGTGLAVFATAPTFSGMVTVNDSLTVSDRSYNSTTWNNSMRVPTANAIRDKFEALSTAYSIDTALFVRLAGRIGGQTINQLVTISDSLKVSDRAYDGTTWNNSMRVPTSNAVRDKIESLTADGLGGANKALSNLSSVAVNTSLIPGTSSLDLGSSTLPWNSLYLYGTKSTRLIGSATGTNKVITFPDATGTVALTSQLTGGTVTSVGMTVPTGLTISGSPVTGSGTLALSYTSGYSIPTTAKQTQWDTAYSAISGIRDTLSGKQDIILSKTADSTAISLYPLEIGSLYQVADAGMVPIINSPIVRAAYGDSIGFKALVDGRPIFKGYGLSDGAGSYSSLRLDIPVKTTVSDSLVANYGRIVNRLGVGAAPMNWTLYAAGRSRVDESLSITSTEVGKTGFKIVLDATYSDQLRMYGYDLTSATFRPMFLGGLASATSGIQIDSSATHARLGSEGFYLQTGKAYFIGSDTLGIHQLQQFISDTLRSRLTDETGIGPAVFATNPTLNGALLSGTNKITFEGSVLGYDDDASISNIGNILSLDNYHDAGRNTSIGLGTSIDFAVNSSNRMSISDWGASITGLLNVSTISHATTDLDKFLVDSAGYLRYRTGSELLSDIGAGASGANTSLSNLTTTSINQSLLPSSTNTYDLGSYSKKWSSLIANYIIAGTYIDGGTYLSMSRVASFPGADGLDKGSIFVKNDDKLYYRDNSGTEFDLTATGGGSGTVTSVSSGNGMNFTTITGSGSVTMGTPSSITGTSTNGFPSSTTHTHELGTVPVSKGGTGISSTIVKGSVIATTSSNVFEAISSDTGTKVLTNVDGNISWEDAPDAEYTATVTLTSADILALNTSPITVVECPSSSYAIEVLSCSANFDYSSGTYVGYVGFSLGTLGTSGAQQYIISSLPANTDCFKRGDQNTISGAYSNMSPGGDLILYVFGGNPTGGVGTAKVYIRYRIITL